MFDKLFWSSVVASGCVATVCANLHCVFCYSVLYCTKDERLLRKKGETETETERRVCVSYARVFKGERGKGGVRGKAAGLFYKGHGCFVLCWWVPFGG